MSDKYDEAVAHLKRNPDRIVSAWLNYSAHRAGCLFTPASRTGTFCGEQIGCLTMIRADSTYRAQTKRLTRAIAKDVRIPNDENLITVKHLPIFAEWQRRIDKELGRK